LMRYADKREYGSKRRFFHAVEMRVMQSGPRFLRYGWKVELAVRATGFVNMGLEGGQFAWCRQRFYSPKDCRPAVRPL
jgi:hypothetical protein